MRSLSTVAALNCLKSLLMVFNVLFWCSGIALLCLGIWLNFELHKFLDLSTTGESGGYTAPYVLIGTGVIVLFLATLACCCTVNEQPILLYIYAFSLGIVFVVLSTVLLSAFAYRTQLSEAFETGLNSSMNVYNVDHSKTSAILRLQSHMHCCGVKSPNDWHKTKYGKIPGSCCKTNMSCDTKDARLIYKVGCHTLVTNLISDNFVFVGYLGLGIACYMLLGIALAILLAKLLQKTNYQEIN